LGTSSGTTNIGNAEEYLKQYYDSYNIKYYGDAMYEISSQAGTSQSNNQKYGWQNSDARFIKSSSTCIERGGQYDSSNSLGVFAFVNVTAVSKSYRSFRVVLCIE